MWCHFTEFAPECKSSFAFLVSLYIYFERAGGRLSLFFFVCFAVPFQYVRFGLTICLALLSRWFLGSHICPLTRNHWKQERWCPQVQPGLTMCSPGCCRTLWGIQGWILNLLCLVTYRHMLPPLVANGKSKESERAGTLHHANTTHLQKNTIFRFMFYLFFIDPQIFDVELM